MAAAYTPVEQPLADRLAGHTQVVAENEPSLKQ